MEKKSIHRSRHSQVIYRIVVLTNPQNFKESNREKTNLQMYFNAYLVGVPLK